MTPVTILGGGPAGLAVAFYAARAGVPFALYERAPTFGGLCRTFACGEHRYDSGAHRFHDRDPAVTADVRSLLGEALRPVAAPSQIFDRGRFVDFPPTPLGLLRSTGIREAGRIGVEILAARLRRRAAPRSFAEFAEHQFGASLARRYLLGYSEKLWGLPADRLSPEVATRRLQGMTVTSLLAEVFRPDGKTRHIDGDFLYPQGGYGAIADALTRALPGEALHATTGIEALECVDARVRRLVAGGRTIEVPGRVVSTLPLTRLVRLLEANLPAPAVAAAAKLRFRDVRLVFLRLARDAVSPNASIYIPDPGLAVSRLSEPRNRCPTMAPVGETSLVAEVPCSPGEPTHRSSDGALARRVVDEVASLGLLRPADVVEWRHHLLRHAYPVYSIDYGDHVDRVLGGLAGIGNLDLVGRGGRFFYSHLHDQMRAARDCVAAWPRHVTSAPRAS